MAKGINRDKQDLYVHYGCYADDFDIDRFQKISNISFLQKPFGGFWASPAHSDGMPILFDWAEFCRINEYRHRGGIEKKFYFCLNKNAHLARIETMDDYNALPKIEISNEMFRRSEKFIDFEECVRQGIDAIEYAYAEAHWDKDIGDEMDLKMLGWDCDSILIMNPDIILRESFL